MNTLFHSHGSPVQNTEQKEQLPDSLQAIRVRRAEEQVWAFQQNV